METFALTPKSNNPVEKMVFSGSFGQPDGFGSVLHATVSRSGSLCLELHWKDASDGGERFWAIELDDQQRNALAAFAGRYQPKTFHVVDAK